jgi:hypothetical protein
MTHETMRVLREEILVIGIACVRKVLNDDQMLSKDPDSRSTYLITN